MKRLLLGTFFGALAVFLWNAFSWMVLPWHTLSLKSFTNETAVGEVLQANAPAAGLYLLPNPHGSAKEDRNYEAGVARMRAGPFLFGVVRPGTNNWSMPVLLIGSFVTQAAAAFIITALLLTTRLPTYWGRVLFVVMVAAVAGVLGHLPYYNWWEFPAGWTVSHIADLLVGWFLGGLVLAAIARATPPVGRV